MNELEKLITALALAVFTFIFSDNVGRLIYGPDHIITKQGYDIAVEQHNRDAERAPVGLPDILDMVSIMSQANAVEGDKIFHKVCTLCHTIEKDGSNKVGPNLWGIFGINAAHKSDFQYSGAMQDRRKDGKLWTDEELYRFIFAPKQYVQGTKMAFVGIKNDKERADVVAYLETMR